MKKLGLKVLSITLSVTNLLNFSPIKINAAGQTIPAKTINTNLNKNPKEESKAKRYLKTGLKVAGAAAATCVSLYALRIGLLSKFFNLNTEILKKMYLQDYKDHIEPNKLTKRQEGFSWCWVACLQAQLKTIDIEKEQKEIYQEISGKSASWFEALRFYGLISFENLENAKKSTKGSYFNDSMTYIGNVKNYINQLTLGNYKFEVEFFNVNDDNDDDNDVDKICKLIKQVYEKTSHHPFGIIDCNLSSPHMVNVVEIDKNDNIVIECPQTELRRTESLEEFVRRYKHNANLKELIKDAGVPGFSVYYLSPTA